MLPLCLLPSSVLPSPLSQAACTACCYQPLGAVRHGSWSRQAGRPARQEAAHSPRAATAAGQLPPCCRCCRRSSILALCASCARSTSGCSCPASARADSSWNANGLRAGPGVQAGRTSQSGRGSGPLGAPWQGVDGDHQVQYAILCGCYMCLTCSLCAVGCSRPPTAAAAPPPSPALLAACTEGTRKS